MSDSNVFDYIVVGAGSSGCVVAGRLSADPGVRVLLIEAGPKPMSPWLKIPGAVSKVIGPSRYNWAYQSLPEPELNNREIYWPRGKTLGGSGAINGMVWLRGHPQDYEGWRQMGNTGWGWEDVAPLFRRAEAAIGVGPAVTRYAFTDLFVDAARDAGFGLRDDFNSDDDEFGQCTGFLSFSIRNGVRRSSYDAFVAPYRGRPNLTVVTGAMVERVDLDGARATGVTYVSEGKRRSAKARREVILSGGSVNSPKLLMLSGVGPGEHLRALGINVALDRAGVGQNLHDHTNTAITWHSPPEYSINSRIRWPRLAGEVARYFAMRTGILAVGTSGASVFASIMGGPDYPDLQISVRPFSFVFGPKGVTVAETPCVTVAAYQMRPESRGEITLRSKDPAEPPDIIANYLKSAADRATVVAGVRLIERIMSGPRMTGFSPRTPLPADDEALLDVIRGIIGPVFHPVGTCRMGADPDSVVDPRLRVRGIEGLRVADASIMPAITSTNINAACVMIGEKAADLIAEDWR